MNVDTTMLIDARRLGLAQGVPNAIVNIHCFFDRHREQPIAAPAPLRALFERALNGQEAA
jgi:hypothetical protein